MIYFGENSTDFEKYELWHAMVEMFGKQIFINSSG